MTDQNAALQDAITALLATVRAEGRAEVNELLDKRNRQLQADARRGDLAQERRE